MNYFSSLFLLFFSLSLHSQVLTRSSSDLMVKLPATSNQLTACKDAKHIDVKLLEKTKDENELTCSDQNSWKLVSTLENQEVDRYVFDDQPLGIYKVVVKMLLYCSESKAKSKYKIAKVYESNVLNERTDLESASPTQISEELISVFPNPSAEKVWVSLSENITSEKGKFSIQLLNGAGQLVKEEVISEQILAPIDLDISDYPAGQYTILILKDDVFFATQKIAKITK